MNIHTGAPKTPKATRSPQGDRFIPQRSSVDGDMALYNLCNENDNPQTPRLGNQEDSVEGPVQEYACRLDGRGCDGQQARKDPDAAG